jgi:N-ethylmaleimide reductase
MLKMTSLFNTYALGTRKLQNRIVMAPMTRARTSTGDVPNALMATYYAQRANAGLIIAEATDVSAYSKGYACTPGIYTEEQTQGWRVVTDQVHRQGGTIFLQIWHVGRVAHHTMLPNGEAPRGPTDERAAQSDVFIYDSNGTASFVRADAPRKIETEEVAALLDEFTLAFRNAKAAGFDGVEIHGANGYLFDQFMNSTLNTRTDQFGGQTPQTRTRLLLDVVDLAIRELGADKVGVRVSPFGKFNSMPSDPFAEETLLYLCSELSRREIAYLHVVYQLTPEGNTVDSEYNEKNLSDDFVRKVRKAFHGTLIWCGGFDKRAAQAALDAGWADLIAFGRPFIANPDLVARLKNNWPLAEAHHSTFYTRDGEKGYTDFQYFE